MLMGNFRIGSRTGGGLGDREKRDDDEGGLKKVRFVVTLLLCVPA
jgi:hypothetical protein